MPPHTRGHENSQPTTQWFMLVRHSQDGDKHGPPWIELGSDQVLGNPRLSFDAATYQRGAIDLLVAVSESSEAGILV
jgi:hypothetical protein